MTITFTGLEQRDFFLNHLTLTEHNPSLKLLRKLFLHFQKSYLTGFGLSLILMYFLIGQNNEL